MSESNIIHLYFVPGLAANTTIFENINLPDDRYEIHLLKWPMPKPKEKLSEYAGRMCKYVKHENVVLLGVSFGGVVVQEMAKIINPKRLIIVSSVKSRNELPRRMRFARKTGIYKIFPTGLLSHIDFLGHFVVGNFLKKKMQLYKKYLSITDTRYLDWSLEKMICWDQKKPMKNIIHIHGDEDEIFPFKYIKGCIRVPGGTHVMIINRFRWFNENLPEIIEHGNLKNENQE